MKSLLFCCLFGTFLATGMCLDCDICIELGQKCTGGWTKTCEPDEDTCVAFQTEIIKAPLSITFTAKTCGTSDTCSLDYVETSIDNDVTLRSKRACCTGDECKNQPVPVLEPQVSQPNGLHCPGCIGLTSTECNENLVACQGSENQCLSIKGKKSDFIMREMALKGCASESMCALLEKRLWRVLGEDVEGDIKCSPALTQISQ